MYTAELKDDNKAMLALTRSNGKFLIKFIEQKTV